MKILHVRNDWPSQLGKLLRASWISLLIIGVVILLSSLDQSDTIVVDLLDRNSANLLLFVVLTFFLTQIISHYPIYLEYNRNKGTHTSEETIWTLHPVLLGFGFITFDDSTSGNRSRLVRHFRNLWGLLLLTAVFYLLIVVHSRNIELFAYQESSVQGWLWGQVALYLLWVVITYVLMNTLLSDARAKRTTTSHIYRYRQILLLTTLILFAATLFIAVFFSATAGWSQATYWWTYALLLTAGPFYSATRSFRKQTLLRNDLTFLIFIAVGGFSSLALLVLAHFIYFRLNPLVILLAQLIIIYGLVVIPMKHHFYYRQQARAGNIRSLPRFVFVWLMPAWIPLLLVWAFVAGKSGNDLHLLPVIKEQPDSVVEFKQFVNDFDTHFAQKDTIYFIASFGGGLKANIWNQLIFERLSNYGGRNILSSTAAISGVSGGAIGHAVFGGLYQKYGPYVKGDTILRENIRNLGKKNFVSLDLTYLLGLDLLRELLPDFLAPNLEHTNDRAKLAMQEYSDFVNNGNDMLDLSYRAYWARLYRQERRSGRFFPAFIGNAAGTHIQRGIACSVKMEGEEFKNTFFDSTDLLSFADSLGRKQYHSLPYLYAASCTNRFPLFSPAAKVEHKGHFIDGGYFENSGMLSLLDFYEKLKTESKLFRNTPNAPKVVFIQIINGREEYLKSLMVDPYKKRIKEASELSSIFGTVTSISFVPSYLMTKNALVEQTLSRADTIRDSTRVYYAQIHLPYYVTKGEMKELLKLRNIKLDTATKQRMNESNALIMGMMHKNWYGYVQPPLARLLGKQAVNYMEAALSQCETWEDLNRILYITCKPTPAVVTKKSK